MQSRSMRLSLFVILITLFSSANCHADTVDVGIGGHLLGPYFLTSGGGLGEQFTLDQETLITSFHVGIAPDYLGSPLDGSWEVTVTGWDGTYVVNPYQDTAAGVSSGWVTTPLPQILPAGNYLLSFIGGPCGSECPQNAVAEMDYYSPSTSFDVGGSATGIAGFNPGIGFEITGVAVPETSTWILVGTALVLILMQRFHRRRA